MSRVPIDALTGLVPVIHAVVPSHAWSTVSARSGNRRSLSRLVRCGTAWMAGPGPAKVSFGGGRT